MDKQAAKAVRDFTTGDERRFRDRLGLALDAAREFRQRDVAFDFVVLLHGAATQFAARRLAGTKFGSADLSAGHEAMHRFREAGVVPGVDIERNVHVSAIALQNRGYAYIPVF